VLPANVRLDWKVIARYKHSSLFGLIISNKEKKFKTLTAEHSTQKKFQELFQLRGAPCFPGENVVKLFATVI
jgi:hypothetical protein